jgi:two-component system, OmpR family, alkaline phosphatase synthesis response regulator PhoP
MNHSEHKRILVIEDDPTIAELLAYNLRQAGYEVIQERDGHSGLNAALSYDVDLALVDLMLPELDGMAVSREIVRSKPDVPVIMLTARTEREMMLAGFECGADDYMTKPFDLDELLARIAARLRRTTSRAAEPPSEPYLTGITLDSDSHVLSANGQEVFLKPKEHDLLDVLLSRPGHLFRREELTYRVWQQQYNSASRTLDVHVRYLRVKLSQIEAPLTIENVRGVGYRVVRLDTDATE